MAESDLRSEIGRLRAACLLRLAQRLGYGPDPARVAALVADKDDAGIIAALAAVRPSARGHPWHHRLPDVRRWLTRLLSRS